MSSSTSHSSPKRSRFPRQVAVGLATAVLAWLVAAGYTVWLNPEVTGFTNAARVKLAWARRMEAQFTNRVVVFGGSSSTFSVDGKHALRAHNLPIANLAMGAGMGARVLTRFALAEVHRGDTLLMTFEPGLLVADLEITQLGYQFAIAAGKPEYASPSKDLFPEKKLAKRNYLAALRPGGYHFFTLLGKLVRGQPLYRYTPAGMDEAGQQRTPVRLPLVTPRGKLELSPAAREWLKALAAWCDQNGVKLLYAFPWTYCPAAQKAEFQAENLRFLAQMLEFMPALRDPRLGAYEVEAHFSDSPYHLNTEGAILRTDELAAALKAGLVWRKGELPAAP